MQDRFHTPVGKSVHGHTLGRFKNMLSLAPGMLSLSLAPGMLGLAPGMVSKHEHV